MDATTRDDVRDLRGRMDSLKRDLADLTRHTTESISNRSRMWATQGKDWAVTHPKTSIGVLAGVAVGIGFGLGFWLGRSNR